MYSYSTDEEYFIGDFEDIEEAIVNGLEADSEADTIWVGKQVPACSFLDNVNYIGKEVVERLNEALYDFISVEYDDILIMSKDDTDNLNKLIIDYVKEKGQFDFHGVDRVGSYERKDYQHLLED